MSRHLRSTSQSRDARKDGYMAKKNGNGGALKNTRTGASGKTYEMQRATFWAPWGENADPKASGGTPILEGEVMALDVVLPARGNMPEQKALDLVTADGEVVRVGECGSIAKQIRDEAGALVIREGDGLLLHWMGDSKGERGKPGAHRVSVGIARA